MLESMSGIVPALALGLRISVRERYRIKHVLLLSAGMGTQGTPVPSHTHIISSTTSSTVQVTLNPPAYIPQYPVQQGYGPPQ
ncbi:unnamed protein product [Arctogadus glacialis]